MQVEEVLTCVKILSEIVAMLPLSLKRKTRKSVKDANDHPVAKFLRRKVNPYTTAYQFKQWLAIDYLTANFGVAVITRDTNGVINGLWQQDAKYTRAVRDAQTNWELYYEIRLDSIGVVPFLYKNVLTVVNFNNSGVLGNNIVDLAQGALQTSNATVKYAQDFFKQGIAPDGFIEWTDTVGSQETTEAVRNELKEDLARKYAGTGKYHQALLLPNGAKWVQVQTDMQKVQAVATRKFNRQIIASMFRVAPFLMGEPASNLDEQWLSQIKCILPILTNFENSFNTMLLSEEEQDKGFYFKFNVDALERGNLATRMQAYATAANNGLKLINEIRAKEDDPPVEGGDVMRQNSAMTNIDHSSNAGGQNENSNGTDNNGKLQNGN